MKKLIALVAVVLLVGLAGTASAQLAQVSCIGTESGGPGGSINCGVLPYVYLVTPGINLVTDVYVGTGDPFRVNYRNVCMPAGWTLTIEPSLPNYLDDPKSAHGTISGNTGLCPYRMHFSGPGQAAPFELGFFHPFPSHDVTWETNDGSAANWAAPVGLGMGPIHAPPMEDHLIPTLSQWGMIAVVLLLLVAGMFYIARRQRSMA